MDLGRTKHWLYTPGSITKLFSHEIFVFGSNLAGMHGGGAASFAMHSFGAIWGKGTGMQGQSYAIPTMHGGVNEIRPYVDEFISFASNHTDFVFYVTRVGCGIAGFTDEQMAPLFAKAIELKNVVLPFSFVKVLSASPYGTRDVIENGAIKTVKVSELYEKIRADYE